MMTSGELDLQVAKSVSPSMLNSCVLAARPKCHDRQWPAVLGHAAMERPAGAISALPAAYAPPLSARNSASVAVTFAYVSRPRIDPTLRLLRCREP
jgi:hypothetical protein